MLIANIGRFQLKMNLLAFSRNRILKRLRNYLFVCSAVYIVMIVSIHVDFFGNPQLAQPNADELVTRFNYNADASGEDFDFSSDVLALLHIQKTGGSSWEKHIYNHLEVRRSVNGSWDKLCTEIPHRKRHVCSVNGFLKPLFYDRYMSRFCDIHADFTELKNCLMFDLKNRIAALTAGKLAQGIAHMITFLRDPVHRYVSEYEHVKREGATWYKAIRTCNNQELYVNKCYKNNTWEHVSWEEFLSCEYNLANNRQTRMLANYNILSCNSLKCWAKSSNCTPELKHFYERKLLQSAKHSLLALAYFGLTEYQEESEYLFLKVFDENKFRFTEPIAVVQQTNAEKALKNIGKKLIEKVEENNRLDVELYEFAKDLFFKRVAYFRSKDKSFVNDESNVDE